jgi:hypothetical protein
LTIYTLNWVLDPFMFHILRLGNSDGGKAIQFFLAKSDQLAFEDVLRSSGDIAFLNVWPSSAAAAELATSVVRKMGDEVLDVLIARKDDIGSIRFSPIKGRDVFSCDPTLESVVEFSRCYATDRFIRAGRLFRNDKYWDDRRVLVSKPDAFIEWSERLYSLAKKSLTKVEQGYFAGAEALKLRKAGVAFEGLDIEVGSIAD